MLSTRVYRIIVSIFSGLIGSLIFCSCEMVFSGESLPGGLNSFKVNISLSDLLFLIVAIEELYPFVFKKSGSISHHIFNMYNRLKK